jgi:glycosyltransferase involved in cell wall biosynthesis
MTIIAVVPAYNEGRTIKRVLEATKPNVDKIIVVDDGSTDDTYVKAAETATYVIRHKKNKGVGIALEAGIQKALKVGADWIVALDADGEHDPREIPLLLDAARRKKADIVIGSRFLRDGEAVRMPLIKRASNALSTIMFGAIYRVRLTDTQSGFRVYEKKVFEGIDWSEDGMLFNTEILIASSRRHLKVLEVPIVSVSSGKRFGNHQFEEVVTYPFLLVKNIAKKS